jgi:hypothetical protein
MSEVGNIYDNGPISPIAKIKENLSIWTNQQWSHYRIDFIEGMPRSSPMMVEMVTATGNTSIAANGTIAKALVAILSLAELDFVHLRWEPLDDMEGVLWEQASKGRYVTRGTQARVTRFSSVQDPWLATTTFCILGMNRDMQLEVRNPNPVIMPQARFVFWGYRYVLSALTKDEGAEIQAGRRATTWVPAEGK